MGQLGFFDADKRLQALSARGDPLEAIDHVVPWDSFRAEIEAVVLTPDELKKSSAGRKPFDAILMFRMLVLQTLQRLHPAPLLRWVLAPLVVFLVRKSANKKPRRGGASPKEGNAKNRGGFGVGGAPATQITTRSQVIHDDGVSVRPRRAAVVRAALQGVLRMSFQFRAFVHFVRSAGIVVSGHVWDHRLLK